MPRAALSRLGPGSLPRAEIFLEVRARGDPHRLAHQPRAQTPGHRDLAQVLRVVTVLSGERRQRDELGGINTSCHKGGIGNGCDLLHVQPRVLTSTAVALPSKAIRETVPGY